MTLETAQTSEQNPYESFIERIKEKSSSLHESNPSVKMDALVDDVSKLSMEYEFYNSLFEARDNMAGNFLSDVDKLPWDVRTLRAGTNGSGEEYLRVVGFDHLTTQQIGMAHRLSRNADIKTLNDEKDGVTYYGAGKTLMLDPETGTVLIQKSTYTAILNEFLASDPEAIKNEAIHAATGALGRGTLAISQDAEHLQSELTKPESSWIVSTGLDNPDMTMALVQHTESAPTDMATIIELLKGEGKPALIFVPKDDLVLNNLAEEMGLVEPGPAPLMEYRVDQYEGLATVKNPRLAKVVKVKSMDVLEDARQIQSDTLHIDLESLRLTVGEKVLNDSNVLTFVGYLDKDKAAGLEEPTEKNDSEENKISSLAEIEPANSTHLEKDLVPATTATFVVEGDVATVWSVGTEDRFQGKGLGYEVMIHGMRECIEKGVKTFYLISSEEGERLYEKLGFTTIQQLQLWLLDSAESQE